MQFRRLAVSCISVHGVWSFRGGGGKKCVEAQSSWDLLPTTAAASDSSNSHRKQRTEACLLRRSVQYPGVLSFPCLQWNDPTWRGFQDQTNALLADKFSYLVTDRNVRVYSVLPFAKGKFFVLLLVVLALLPGSLVYPSSFLPSPHVLRI